MGGTKRPLWEEDDLIQKILVWLPVASLLRFKSVCKSWCALIESSFFIHLQHTTFKSSSSSSSHNFGSFILHVEVKFPRFRETALLMLSSESESESSESECVSRSRCSRSFSLCVTGSNRVCVCGWSAPISDYKSGDRWWSSYGYCGQCYKWNFSRVSNYHQQLVLKLDNLGFPSCYQFDNDDKKIIKRTPPPIVIGSCNGLICLHDSELNDVSLWNPATRQFRILPKSSITIDGDCLLHHRLFAFGFDDETKDFKVVLLSGLKLRPRRRIIDDVVGPMGCLCRVQVYSLSTDSWRVLEGITYLPGSPFHCPDSSSSSSGIYLNGRYFFMAKFLYPEQCIPPKNSDRFIISLDLTKEIIIPIQLPHHSPHIGLYLCCLGDKIALFTKFTGGNATIGRWEGFHIWVLLNKHSSSSSSSVNNESWKQLHLSFKVELLPDEWNIPISISNDGVFALLETVSGFHNTKKKMKLYNLITKKVKKTFLSCNQVLSKAYAYKPSLVSITAAAADKVIGEAAAAAADKVIGNDAAAESASR